MYSEILANVRTRQEADLLVSELEGLLEKLYSSQSGDFDKAIGKQVRPGVASEIKKALQLQAVDREKFLRGLIEAVKKLKVVRLTLAFEAREDLVEAISDWLRTYLPGQGVILDLSDDKSILGGALVSYEGMFGDFSLKKSLDEIV